MVRSVSTREVALYLSFYGAVVRPHIFFQAYSQKSSRICDQLVVNFEPCLLDGVCQNSVRECE